MYVGCLLVSLYGLSRSDILINFDRARYGVYMTYAYLLASILNFSALRVGTSYECEGGFMCGFVTDVL